jgi:peptidyl-tRNA hydrolase, PTH1 family
MWLMVGLGNPGKKYEKTRHNVGFLVVETIAKKLDAIWKVKTELFGELAETHSEEEKIILAKPQTFMNLSGKNVASLMHRFHIEPQHLIVISDDVDLPVGTIRTRNEGSAGGHNGLKSIITSLGTQQFTRIKIGVGTHPTNIPLEDWVLSPFPAAEAKIIPTLITKAGDIALDIVHGRMNTQTTHTLPSSPTP